MISNQGGDRKRVSRKEKRRRNTVDGAAIQPNQTVVHNIFLFRGKNHSPRISKIEGNSDTKEGKYRNQKQEHHQKKRPEILT